MAFFDAEVHFETESLFFSLVCLQIIRKPGLNLSSKSGEVNILRYGSSRSTGTFRGASCKLMIKVEEKS